ncbi:MAG: hypothetical protein AAGC81_17320 [Pseudomonadota bacterium]
MWTSVERAEITRLKNSFGQGLYDLYWTEGTTDLEEPWLVAMSFAEDALVLHIARIGGFYVALDDELGRIAEDQDLQTFISACIHYIRTPNQRTNAKIVPLSQGWETLAAWSALIVELLRHEIMAGSHQAEEIAQAPEQTEPTAPLPEAETQRLANQSSETTEVALHDRPGRLRQNPTLPSSEGRATGSEPMMGLAFLQSVITVASVEFAISVSDAAATTPDQTENDSAEIAELLAKDEITQATTQEQAQELADEDKKIVDALWPNDRALDQESTVAALSNAKDGLFGRATDLIQDNITAILTELFGRGALKGGSVREEWTALSIGSSEDSIPCETQGLDVTGTASSTGSHAECSSLEADPDEAQQRHDDNQSRATQASNLQSVTQIKQPEKIEIAQPSVQKPVQMAEPFSLVPKPLIQDTPSLKDISVAVFLIDTDTEERVARIEQDGTVDAGVVESGKYSIEVAFSDGTVAPTGSVSLSLNGSDPRVENIVPYALFGDGDGNYYGNSLITNGAKDLKIAIHSEAHGKGETTDFNFQFEVEGAVHEETAIDPIPELGEGSALIDFTDEAIEFDSTAPFLPELDEDETAEPKPQASDNTASTNDNEAPQDLAILDTTTDSLDLIA